MIDGGRRSGYRYVELAQLPGELKPVRLELLGFVRTGLTR